MGMLAILDRRLPAVIVLPELAPARAVTLPPPGLPDPRSLAVLGDGFVVADFGGAGLAQWDGAAAAWHVSHPGVFQGVTGLAVDAAGLILVASASGLWSVRPADGTAALVRAPTPGTRCVGVAVAGDGRIALTLSPVGVVVSADQGATWQDLAAVARPGAIAGLSTGFAVVDAAARAVEVVRTDGPPLTLGAAHGLVGPLAVAPASGGVVVSDAVAGRVRRYVLLSDAVVPAEFVDGLTRPGFPPLFERVVALAAPLPTGAP